MASITVETIKIGRTTYDVKPGDYILDNGSCHQFIAGDKRTLKRDGFTSYHTLIMPKTLVKKIPFIRMTKVNSGEIIKWYF
jgi:hypothetical protein